MTLKKVTNYLSNVGRSIEYATVDVLKEKAPSIASLAETNHDISMAVSSGVRNRRAVARKVKQGIVSSDMYTAAEQAKRSVFEDIRTGNFYNKAREDAISMDIMDAMGGDDDFEWDDFSFGDSDEDYDDYSVSEVELDSSEIVSKALDRTTSTSTNALSNTMAGLADYSVSAQQALVHSQITTSIENTSRILEQMIAINDNIIAGRDINEIHVTGAENAKRYYEESIDLKKEDNAILKEILEMQRNLYNKEASEDTGGTRVEYDDIVDYSGVPDLEKYFKMVSQNIQSKTSSVTGMGDMFGEGNFWMAFAASPLEFIPKMVVSKLITDNLDSSIKSLDKSMSGVFSAIMTKFNEAESDYDGNIITNTIGEIFGVRNRLDKTIDTSKYEKGAVAWDGKARQSLIEVIPSYLAQLVALQSGKPEKVYDYDKGKFIESVDIQEEYDSMIASSSRLATMDYRDNMMERLEKSFAFKDIEDRDKFDKDMTTFLDYFFQNQKIFDYNRKDYYDYDRLDLSSNTNYDIIRDLFKTMPKGMQLSFYQDIMSGRSSLNESIRSMESQGDSIYRYLGNESGVGESFDKHGNLKDDIGGVSARLSVERDDHGHTLFDYISKITNTLLEGIIVFPTNGPIMDGGPGGGMPDRPKSFEDNTKYNKAARLEELYPQRTKYELSSYKESIDKRVTEEGVQLIDNVDISRIEDILRDDENTRLLIDSNKPKKQTLTEELLGGTTLYEKGKVLSDKAKDIFRKPQDMISDILNRVDNRLFEVIYGSPDRVDSEGRADGFIELMILNMKDTFQTFNTWLDDKILEPLANKSTKLFGGILDRLGIDVDERGILKSISSHLFGETDEDGEFISRGIFTDTTEQIREDLSGAKKFVLGSNRHLRGIANLLKEYTSDHTLWNTYDQLGILDEISNRIKRVSTIDLEERRIAKRISTIISSTTDKNVGESLTSINDILISAGYSTGDESIWGSIKESLSETKDEIFGTKTEMDKIRDIITDEDAFKPKNIVYSSASKINTIRFKAVYNMLQEFVFKSKDEQASDMNILGELIDKVSPTSKLDYEMKEDLVRLYKSGSDSGDYKRMAMDMLRLFESRGGIKGVNKVLSMINRFINEEEMEEKASTTSDISGIIKDGVEKITPLTDIFTKDDLDGSYEDGLYKVQGEEEIVAVHKGERILTDEDAKDLNPIIDSLLEMRDGESTDETYDRLMGNISRLVDRFKPKTDKDAEMKASASDVVTKYSTGESTIDEVFNELSKIIGIDPDSDDIKYPDTLVGQIKKNASDQFKSLNRLLFGTEEAVDEDGIKEDVEITVGDIMKDVVTDYKHLIPKGISGALMGGAAGLLPGIIGGPLAWATIGAGVSIMQGSDNARDLLFGDIGEDGKREGGVIPKGILDGIEKFAPGMARGGAIGAAAALLPMSPVGIVGGLTLGASTSLITKSSMFQDLMFGDDSLFGPDGKEKIKDGITKTIPGAGIGALIGGMTLGGPLGVLGGMTLGGASSFTLASESFKNMMFGDEIGNDGLISKDTQDRLKDILPASLMATIGIGAVGPFGLLGSSILGTATGIAATSDHFKDAIFGLPDEDGNRTGGFVGGAKDKINEFFTDNIKYPFQQAMDPIKYELGQIGSSIKDSIKTSIDSVFEKAVGIPLGQMVQEKIIEPFTDMTKKFFSGVGKVLGGIISAPFKAIGWIGDNLREKHGGISYASDDEESMLDKLDNKVDEERRDDSGDVSKVIRDGRPERDISTDAVSVEDIIREDEQSKIQEYNESEQDEPKVIDIDDAKVRRVESNKKESSDDGESPAYDSNTSSVTDTPDINKLIRDVSDTKESTDDDDRKEKRSREKTNDYIKDIRDEVHGQLDGVGYNIEKIKNILVRNLGDADATGMETGRGNRKRRGLLGSIMDFVMRPLDFVKDIGSTIMSGITGLADRAISVIMKPFDMLGKAVGGITKGISALAGVAKDAIGGFVSVVGKVAGTIGNIALDLAEGAGKAAAHLFEGVGMLGKEVLGMVSKLPDIISTVMEAGLGVAKFVGKGIGTAASTVGRGIKYGFDSLFNKDIGPGAKKDHMEVTVIGGDLDSVKVVKLVEEVRVKEEKSKKPSNVPDPINLFGKEDDEEYSPYEEEIAAAGLPTPFGMVSFRKDFEGKMVPIKDKIYDMFNKDTKEKDEQMQKVAEHTERSADADEDTAESVEIFNPKKNKKDKDGGILSKLLGGIGGSAIGKLAPLLAIPFLPKIAGFLGDELGGLMPEGRTKDTIMEPLTNLSEKSGMGLTGRVLTVGGGASAKAGRAVIEKGVEVGGPKVIQMISNTVSKIFSNKTVVGAITKILPESGAELCNNLATNLGKQIAENAGEAGAQAIASKMASNMFVVLTVGLIVKDFADGMSRAEEILRMDGKLPIKFRVISGLTNAINNRLTFGIVPIKWIMGVMIKFVGTKEERQDITNAQQKLTQEYESYKQKEIESGKSEKEIMTFDEFNIDTNAGFFRRMKNKRKSNSRIKKNRNKEEELVEQAEQKQSDGYGFGPGRPQSGYNIDDHGCGAKAISYIYGDDENEVFEESIPYMDRNKGLHPRFFRKFAEDNNIDAEMYHINKKGSSNKFLQDIIDGKMILSKDDYGSPHYVVTDGMEEDDVKVIDPSTRKASWMNIDQLIESSNFAVKFKDKSLATSDRANDNLNDMISSKMKVERSRIEESKGTTVGADNQDQYRSIRPVRDTRPVTSQQDDGVIKNLVTIIVSLLKELVLHSQNLDIIVEILSKNLNVDIPDRPESNISLLNAIENLSQNSTNGEIENMATQIASIVQK